MINITLRPGKNGNEWSSVYLTHTGQSFQFPQIVSLSKDGLEKAGEKT
jgi:hypothetical protein